MAASSLLVRQAARYLSEQNTTLWGRAFDINSDDGRALAAEWLAEQFTDFAKYLDRDPLAGLKVPNYVTGVPPLRIQAWNESNPDELLHGQPVAVWRDIEARGAEHPDGRVPYA